MRPSKGHPLARQWTVPWGRVEAGGSPLAAVLREIREEADVDAAVEAFLGVQEQPPPPQGCVALVYLCKHSNGDLVPRDGETDAANYFSLAALNALTEPVESWSEWLVRRAFAGHLTLTA